jgi:hypothetical protein
MSPSEEVVMRKKLASIALSGTLFGTVLAATDTSAAAQHQSAPAYRITKATSHGSASHRSGVVADPALSHGYLPANQRAYARAKAEAAARVASPEGPTSAQTRSPRPTIKLSWKGISNADLSPGDPIHTPSDSTGAIGTTRYIETINSEVAIYDRNKIRLSFTPLGDFWAAGAADVFDPQVIWDPNTKRFYYAGDAVFSNTDNRLAFGWSTTASPTNATTDWCQYFFKYGAEFPDYPKLGDTKEFIVIGTNVFAGTSLRGSDILALDKPPSGTTCPSPGSIDFDLGKNIAVGTIRAFTPVPANQTDGNSTGWVAAIPLTAPGTAIDLFKVNKNADGTPHVQTGGSKVTVPSFSVPPNARQSGTSFRLDTLDTRLTQAVSAIDPGHGGKVGLWTQHTVAGGGGSMIRWYEIDPAGRTVLQTGAVKNSTAFYFNGAISPDRVVSGPTRAFGRNMVLSFNASSSSTFPSIRMVSKRGSKGVSAPVVVKSSPGFDADFACGSELPNVCRWGDYAAATPDPAAPTTGTTTGRVWHTSMWTIDASTIDPSSDTSWRTWNWEAKP